MRSIILSLLVLIQMLVISFLGINIYGKMNKKILGVISINPINKNSVIIRPTKHLKYFSEPRASTIIEDKTDWLSFIPKHTINSDSLNEQVDYAVSKPANTFRVITLGDSFTYGLYVNSKDSWVKLLEEKFNNVLACKNIKKFEVINLGVPSYDIEYSVERFLLRGKKYNPDLVLWFLKDDDFNIINEYFIPQEQKAIKESNININTTDFYFKNGEPYPLFLKIIEEIKKQLGEKVFFDYQINALKKINEFYKEKLLIFTFPITNDRYKNIMEEFVKSRKYSYFYKNLINIYEIGGLSFPDSHPNQKGHQIIAKDLFDYLIKNKIIPCN